MAGNIKLAVSISSQVFVFLTSGLDPNKVVGMRVPKTATKSDSVPWLEKVLVGEGKREEHELFTHGREGQWGWELWVRGPGLGRMVRMKDGVEIAEVAWGMTRGQ